MSPNRILMPWALGLVLALTLPAAAEMELATNFWNMAWQRPADAFWDCNAVKGDDPWNPRFLRNIAIYRAFRFMDWGDHTSRKWTDRNPRANPKQNPVAYEWMIDLCNRMNADMWITIPHPSINRDTGDQPCDYVVRLCILAKTGVDMKAVELKPHLDRLASMTAEDFIAAGGIRTGAPLKPDLKLYLEYSNETWNQFTKMWPYVCDEGQALHLDPDRSKAGNRFHAWAAIRMFRAANLVFGEDSKRVVRVLNAQTVALVMGQQYFEVMDDPRLNPWKVKADAVATGPYFGHAVDGAAPDAVAKCREAIRAAAAQSQEYKKLADAHQVRLIAYEGGQHLLNNAQILNRKPAMGELYGEYLQAMSPYFDLFAHYNHVGRFGPGGAWGALEFTGQPEDASPKYTALAAWSKAHPPRKPQP